MVTILVDLSILSHTFRLVMLIMGIKMILDLRIIPIVVNEIKRYLKKGVKS